ncbi:MAG: hypothetical protein ABSH10_03850 [Phycisphaerae bacterium]
MKCAAILMCVAGVALCGNGCTGRAISEGLGEVKGATGLVMPIQPASTAANRDELADYHDFKLGEITDDIGGRVPRDFRFLLREEFARQLAAKKLPSERRGKTLLIRGSIVHYEDAGHVGMFLSPLEEVICRTEFVDAHTGRVLAVANCIGRTETTLQLGPKTKAEGLAKAFVSWIDKRYPTTGRSGDEGD